MTCHSPGPRVPFKLRLSFSGHPRFLSLASSLPAPACPVPSCPSVFLLPLENSVGPGATRVIVSIKTSPTKAPSKALRENTYDKSFFLRASGSNFQFDCPFSGFFPPPGKESFAVARAVSGAVLRDSRNGSPVNCGISFEKSVVSRVIE